MKGKPRGFRVPLDERFWVKVQKTGGCWLWSGSKTPKGYGQIRAGGRCGKLLRASRVAYALVFGPIPAGRHVLHSCDNPPCVRPAHLFLGDQRANSEDMVSKGRARGARGVHHRSAKLSPELVREIRRRRAVEGLSMRALGRLYGVGGDQITRIVNRKKWAWVV